MAKRKPRRTWIVVHDFSARHMKQTHGDRRKVFRKGTLWARCELQPYTKDGTTINYLRRHGYLQNIKDVRSLRNFINYLVSTNGGETNVSSELNPSRWRPAYYWSRNGGGSVTHF